MKNLKMTLSAVVVFAVVGSALAFKKQQADIFKCENNVCVSAGAPYSSIQRGPEQSLNFTPYQGTLNAPCEVTNATCVPFGNNPVYIND